MRSVHFEIGNWPEKRRGEKRERMGRDVHQDMQQSAAHFQNRFFIIPGHQGKNNKEYEQAVAEVIEIMR